VKNTAEKTETIVITVISGSVIVIIGTFGGWKSIKYARSGGFGAIWRPKIELFFTFLHFLILFCEK